MMILAHLLTAGGRLDWRDPALQGVLAASHAELSGLAGPDRLAAFSDTEEGLAALAAAGWREPRRIPPVAGGDFAGFLAGPAAGSARDWPPHSAPGPWVFVDLRNPFLASQDVARAVEQALARPGQALVSCGRAVDHPFLQRAMAEVLGLLLVHRLEDPARAAAWLRGQGRDQEADLAGAGTGVLSAPFHSPAVDGPDGSGLLWLPDSSGGVRMFWIPRTGARQVRAALSPLGGEDRGVRVRCPEGGEDMEISVPGLAAAAVAHVHAFDAAGLGSDGELVPVRDGLVRVRLAEVCSGLVLALLRQGQGEYNVERRYQPDRLWSGSQRLCDGAGIFGRQSLPPVHEADFALVACAPDALDRLGRDLCAGKVAGFTGRTDAWLLREPLDLLRLEAWRRERAAQGELSHG